MLFLHGAGERGSDNEKQLIHGSQMFLNPTNRENFPAFVLFPQCPEKRYWAFPGRPSSFTEMNAEKAITPILLAVKELVDSYLENPAVDASRVYIMGLSMGGMATFDLVSRYPEIFAAAIPICGSVNPQRLKQNAAGVKKVKFRLYHGDADIAVSVEGSRQAYKALKEIGADVEYFEFPGCTHNSWNPAFNRPDFLKWLFKQKR